MEKIDDFRDRDGATAINDTAWGGLLCRLRCDYSVQYFHTTLFKIGLLGVVKFKYLGSESCGPNFFPALPPKTHLCYNRSCFGA